MVGRYGMVRTYMHGPEGMDGVGADHTLGLLGYGVLQLVALDHNPAPHLSNNNNDNNRMFIQ